jgi:hypothetical protein
VNALQPVDPAILPSDAKVKVAAAPEVAAGVGDPPGVLKLPRFHEVPARSGCESESSPQAAATRHPTSNTATSERLTSWT